MSDRASEAAKWVLIVATAWLLCALLLAVSWGGGLSDCHDATCRVNAGKSRGTGCVFEISRGYVYLLTNAHVVGQLGSVRCEFWRAGYQSAAMPGVVLAREASIDAAIVAIPDTRFGGTLPAAIPLARKGNEPAAGDTVLSVGCAKGGWPTGWIGRVLRYSQDAMLFQPPPADGRSGSAIFDTAGEHIVGLVRAREAPGNRWGYATRLAALYQVFGRRAAYKTQWCPGCPRPGFGGGGGGGCKPMNPYGQPPGPSPYGLSPAPRRQQPQPQSRNDIPWPGLPDRYRAGDRYRQSPPPAVDEKAPPPAVDAEPLGPRTYIEPTRPAPSTTSPDAAGIAAIREQLNEARRTIEQIKATLELLRQQTPAQGPGGKPGPAGPPGPPGKITEAQLRTISAEVAAELWARLRADPRMADIDRRLGVLESAGQVKPPENRGGVPHYFEIVPKR